MTPNAVSALQEGPPSRISVPPSCGIRDRTLGPWPEIRGDGQAAANEMQAACRKPPKKPLYKARKGSDPRSSASCMAPEAVEYLY